MAPTLYYLSGSPPVRAVLMTAKSIGLQLNLKETDLFKDDHRTSDFLKLNPQHTIPTLVDDDGFVIWDSHAIMSYIVTVYGKDDSLYPKDPKKRAIVDQRLHFESGVVFSRLLRIFQPILFRGRKTIDEEEKNGILTAYGFLEAFLENSKWIAGDSVTIADFSLISSIGSLNLLIKVDPEKYPKLRAWLSNAEKLPEYEANIPGLNALESLFIDKFGSI